MKTLMNVLKSFGLFKPKQKPLEGHLGGFVQVDENGKVVKVFIP